MEPTRKTMGRHARYLFLFALASSLVGCDRGPNVEQARERARAVMTEAEAQADALSSTWTELVADVKATAIVPELEAPCAADPRPTPAMRTLIAMATGVSTTGTESLLDRRIPAGSYYLTPSTQLDQSYSPTAAKLNKLVRDLRETLENPEAEASALSDHVREIQRVKIGHEGLIVIDEVQAPKVTDRAKSLFQPGYAIGRGYLLDHETGNTICFASVTAQNKAKVKAGVGLDRAFLEIDLAKAVFENAEERWVAARKR